MFAQKLDKSMRLPGKLTHRKQALRSSAENEQQEQKSRSGSYVFCQDGTLIPVEDPELLEIISRKVTPEGM